MLFSSKMWKTLWGAEYSAEQNFPPGAQENPSQLDGWPGAAVVRWLPSRLPPWTLAHGSCQLHSHHIWRGHVIQMRDLRYLESIQSKQITWLLQFVCGKRKFQLEGRRKENLCIWIIAWPFCCRRDSCGDSRLLQPGATLAGLAGRVSAQGHRFQEGSFVLTNLNQKENSNWWKHIDARRQTHLNQAFDVH